MAITIVLCIWFCLWPWAYLQGTILCSWFGQSRPVGDKNGPGNVVSAMAAIKKEFHSFSWYAIEAQKMESNEGPRHVLSLVITTDFGVKKICDYSLNVLKHPPTCSKPPQMY